MTNTRYADIILPLAVKRRFTYAVPEEFPDTICPGVLVEIQFGRGRLYNGIVVEIHDKPPETIKIKPIIRIIDTNQTINSKQLKFWKWIAEYYLCSEGEVMKAAMSGGATSGNYKPKLEHFIKLSAKYSDEELNIILDNLAKAPRQKDVLTTYLELTGYKQGSDIQEVSRKILAKKSKAPLNIVHTLVKKGILTEYSMEASRLSGDNVPQEPLKKLSKLQSIAFESVKSQFKTKDIVLLHGVTSSGKTEIYIHLIHEYLTHNKQVLYLLPEIALTTQIIQRLKKHFGDLVAVYHSKCSDAERAEIRKRLTNRGSNCMLILGVRSSLFLPFDNLGLVVVDEEHDGSYKQQDPAPRYHARDCAIMLAAIHKAKTILGSASPSIESYYNATEGKYGLTLLNERHGSIKLPEIIIADTKEAYRKKLMVSHFTPELLHAMDIALGRNEQIILFRNRRGFSPYIECNECGWIPVCVQCAVNLTYHKGINKLVCHYCGYTSGIPSTCGSCSSTGMVTRGFGTQKIEDEISIVFPSARVARMDQDTTRSKNSFGKIIRAFEEGEIDILIGTQMVSKGLDFDNLTVVGILNADNMLSFPDFRAHERSFHLMEQVSGRAGRRKEQGKVIIQTVDPTHIIIRQVLNHDYKGMFRMQLEERKAFNYPPFCRMIRINIKHKERQVLNNYADVLGNNLRTIFGKRMLGPESPVISQIQLWYIKTIILKIEKGKSVTKAKELIVDIVEKIEKEKGASLLKIVIDVDPY